MTSPLPPTPDSAPATVSAPPRLPDFIVIGEMRCGSTTLWELLERHPDVAFPEEKELHFFDNRGGKWDAGPAWYYEQFGACRKSARLCGEATPDYLFHAGACERIRATVPDAKLLVILRDPIERAWSHYWHNIRRGREKLSFPEALKAESERLKDPDESVPSHFSYVMRGHYVRRLKHYETVFGRDSLLVVFLDDLIKNQEATVRTICGHLGLDVVPELLVKTPPQRNKADYPRWPALSAFTTGLRRTLGQLPFLKKPAEAIARLTRPFRTYSGQNRMEPQLKAQLVAEYRESDRELERWLGRSVPWAGKHG